MRRTGLVMLAAFQAACSTAVDRVVVGSKNFTESVILGEIIAQQLEANGIPVERKLNLGGTFVCHQAIISGKLDLYVEYSGTARAAVLKLSPETDRQQVLADVQREYADRWNLEWMPRLGFNNTFAILIRGADARQLGITTISGARQFAGNWTPGFGHEFMDREDGFRGLTERYGLEFKRNPIVMDLGLTYRALADGKVDIIAGNSTDGQIKSLDLYQLEDDLHYFPPYDAAPVVRREVLERFPRMRPALEALGGSLSESRMAELNYEVDVAGKTVKTVAAEFLSNLRGGVTSPALPQVKDTSSAK